MRHFIFTLAILISLILPISQPTQGKNTSFEQPVNFAQNGSFEYGSYLPTNLPLGWSTQAFNPDATFTWSNQVSHSGDKSIQITAPNANDASWVQTISVEPNTNYLLTGWIKTENVAYSAQSVQAGANLSLLNTWLYTTPLHGTNDWTQVEMIFNSENNSEISIAARIGFYSGITTGTAWFDQIKLFKIIDATTPSWKILTLIYETTDFTYQDEHGIDHHMIGTMSDTEMDAAAEAATIFVEQDIPALTSGYMTPEITIRYPERPLSTLHKYEDSWTPTPDDIAPEFDSTFDAIMVIWQATVVDQNSGQTTWIGPSAGLSYNRGTQTAYLSIVIEYAINAEHRNVYKHEFGHSILFYYEATGTAPTPTVTNHAYEGQYVHCPTGDAYVWIDETNDNPIPNSVYNNKSGFTHDYYSGTIATADQPTRCLGINEDAWKTGGPVSKPYITGFIVQSSTINPNSSTNPTKEFSVQVTNTGTGTDTYSISISGNEWPIDFPASVGPVAQDESVDVTVSVTIPTSAADGETDTAILTITSNQNPTTISSINLQTTAIRETLYLPMILKQ